MELRAIVKEKKFWIASFLIAWAAGLQGHMMWMQRQDAFKQKFGDPDAGKEGGRIMFLDEWIRNYPFGYTKDDELVFLENSIELE